MSARSQAGTRYTALALLVGVAAAALSSPSRAQRVEVGHGLTVVVGRPAGLTATERIDGRRSASSPVPLPRGSLRVLWTRQLHAPTYPPIVAEDGAVVAVGEQGDLTVLNADGTERAHLQVGPGPLSAPAFLSDGTVVVANGAGDAVGVRGGAVTFRTRAFEPAAPTGEDEFDLQPVRPNLVPRRPRLPRIRRLPPVARDAREAAGLPRSWLLPLDDGGVAVAIDRELLCLDAAGGVRTRTTSPAAVASPLVAVDGAIAFVTEGGEAFTWDLRGGPGAVRRRGSFEGATDGIVATVDGRHLLAVVDGGRLVALDLVTGEAATRLAASGHGLTGAFAVSPGGTVYLEEASPGGTRVLSVDTDGRSIAYAPLLTSRGTVSPGDAGAAASTPALTPTHTALFVDPDGAVAYGTTDGHVGVAAQGSKVELGFFPCGATAAQVQGPYVARQRPSAGFSALVPAGPRAFLVACTSGSLSLVRGD